jgi:hypothetical protein
VLAFVKSSHCVQIGVTENQDNNACRKVYIQHGVWLIAKGAMFAAWSAASSFHIGNIV